MIAWLRRLLARLREEVRELRVIATPPERRKGDRRKTPPGY